MICLGGGPPKVMSGEATSSLSSGPAPRCSVGSRGLAGPGVGHIVSDGEARSLCGVDTAA